MPLVDMTQLTQEEAWAVAYERQCRNDNIAVQNNYIQSYNLTRPANEPAKALLPDTTDQEVADDLAKTGGFAMAINNMYSAKQAAMVPAYKAADLATQSQVDTLLGVPPLIRQ